MRVKPEDLAKRLSAGDLAPLYLVFGDEPLQVEENLDAIRAAAREQGYADRVVLHAETGFDWGVLREYRDSLSLFAERRVVDLRLPAGPGRDGGEALRDYAERPNPDNLLLVSTGKLDGRSTSTKWFKAVDGAGVTVQVWPVDLTRLPGWLARRARGLGLELAEDAARLLAERNEGNLLAAAQELDKLRLIHPRGRVDAEDIASAVADSARFGAFDLVDSALAGDPGRTLRILAGLRDEGLDPLQVLGPVAWALRGAATMRAQMDRGRDLDAALRAAKMFAWQRRKPLVAGAMRRHSSTSWEALLEQAGQVDRMVKGAERGRPWDALQRLCLALSGTPVLSGSHGI